MTELLLGIDIGTASSKGVLVRPHGEIVARAERVHGTSTPRPGWHEHDANVIWWDDLRGLCEDLNVRDRGAIAGVGVSGIGPCLLPCDADDDPLRPAILYGIDTRAEAEVAELTEQLGADEILRRGGSALSSQALGPKLAWLARHEPEVWAATRHWHMVSSFVVARLTGTWVLDRHSASQCDPFYDLAAEDWNREWADAVVPGLPLPPLVWPGEVVGDVHPAGSEATGIPVGTPVIAGTIDAWAEAVSVGVRRSGDLMLMYGSTMFFVLVADEPAGNPSIWTTAGVDPGTLTAAGGMATAGSLTRWLRDLVGGPSFDELIAEAAAVAPGAEGLLLLPYFAGERTPILDPRARGTITGLTIRHDRGHLYRAVLEGVALGVRHNLEALAVEGDVRAVAVGGGTTGGLWPQIVSDVTGRSQEIPVETIGASYGDALLVAESIGLVPPGTSWVRQPVMTEPDPSKAGLYDELNALYRALYPATSDIQHALATIQARCGNPRPSRS
ncbi:MAG: sugar kinase [Solirubrobacterales bacterium]|nr:sugar kinase [Solirubrobacterales bacterium]